MVFPLSDDDSRLSGPAVVTITLVIANVLMYLYQMANPDLWLAWGLIPRELTTGVDLVGTVPFGVDQSMDHLAGPEPIQLTLLTSMFMHGGLMHLGGNLLYLWIFGDNVEQRFGSLRFLIFYLVSGLAATGLQVALAPDSTIPNVGASGAISGIMGAYLVLFPKNKVNCIVFFRILSLPAFVVLGFWIGLQVFSGYREMGAVGDSGGVAYGAHVGGFIAGVAAGLVARTLMKGEPESVLRQNYRADPAAKPLWSRSAG